MPQAQCAKAERRMRRPRHGVPQRAEIAEIIGTLRAEEGARAERSAPALAARSGFLPLAARCAAKEIAKKTARAGPGPTSARLS